MDEMDEMDEHGLPLWPAAERNKQVILEQIAEHLPRTGLVLEIASGTGQHALHFSRALPRLRFQPTDIDPDHLVTLAERQRLAGQPNLLPPLKLDVTAEDWSVLRADVIYNANMVHIAPSSVILGLFRGAARALAPGARLITYGPYKMAGVHTSESNERFDASLKGRNPDWGVRDLDDLTQVSKEYGFHRRDPIAMPANNFLVLWDKH
jgi:SAM-dependent methyltransferase